MLYSHKISVIVLLVYIQLPQASGQQNKVYNNMSLDELLNIDVVVTASKHPEDLFETPLSVTIIKKEEINRSGITSIPEALRLSPGLIVREITPGNYDIHIRGYDDVTKNAYITLPYNTTTLVMIDNRIVYSYFSGGTFWETFPIDLQDIERIEVVRGPASALYGPNAATGVINIITSQAGHKGLNVNANGSAGTNRAKNATVGIGYNWNDKTRLSFSGNFTERRRFDSDYFDFKTQSYTSLENQNMLLRIEKDPVKHELYSFQDFQDQLGTGYDETISLRKAGGNIFYYHRFSELTTLDIAVGAQNSQSQKTGFQNFATPLSQINSKSYYMNSRLKLRNLNGQFNLHSGQDLSNYKFNSYQFTTVDANLEYFRQYNELSFRSGLSYKFSNYYSPITNSEPFKVSNINDQIKDESRIIETYSVSMLTEWKPLPKLRVIGAARIDKFNVNTNYSVNYEMASTYRINKNNLVRYVYSKANRSPFIFDAYLNCNFSLNMELMFKNYPITVPINSNILANKKLDFPVIRSQEICWRSKLSPKISIDIELFYSDFKNFVVTNIYREAISRQHLINQNDIDTIYSITASADVKFENFDLKAQQFGTSFMLIYNPTEKLNVRIYGTYQKTKISGRKDIEFNITSLKFSELQADNTRIMKLNSFTNPTKWNEKLTPSFYGGFYLSYRHNDYWNFSTDAYLTTNQRFIDYDYASSMSDYTGIRTYYSMDIKSNLALNAKVSYNINKYTAIYTTLKNILGRHREFGYADQIGTLCLIGLQYAF